MESELVTSRNDMLDPEDPATDAILAALARTIVSKHGPQGTAGHGEVNAS